MERITFEAGPSLQQQLADYIRSENQELYELIMLEERDTEGRIRAVVRIPEESGQVVVIQFWHKHGELPHDPEILSNHSE